MGLEVMDWTHLLRNMGKWQHVVNKVREFVFHKIRVID